MSDRPALPAIDGWYTLDRKAPHLIGSRCTACSTYFFPKQDHFCGNPACDSTDFDEVELSRTGTLWSYTNACYQPPEPYVSPDPFQPFAIAAVQLEAEQLVVLGQVIAGTGVDDLKVGMPMELVLETLHEDETGDRLIWKWKPMEGTA
jgi:hypothetical protein